MMEITCETLFWILRQIKQTIWSLFIWCTDIWDVSNSSTLALFCGDSLHGGGKGIFDPVHLNISGSALPPISSLITMAAVEQKLSVYFSKEKFNQEKMKQLIQGSVKTLEEKQFGYDIIMHSNYCLLMAEILRVWKQEGFQIKKRKKETVLSEKFTEVSEYISQHYQEDLSVAELAEKFHMSYSYFAAIFKEYYGQTCKEMVLTVRLQKAEDLLQFTDFDLTYISQETGFCDCSHFIKAFKQKYGVTPRKYRMCHILYSK